MATLNFQGVLNMTREGTGERGPWTELEFSPNGAKSFSLYVNGSVDLAQYLRKEMDWSLSGNIGKGGKFYCERVAGSAVKAKS